MLFKAKPVPRAPLDLNRAIQDLLTDVSVRMREFSHIQPARILVVAGEARRASRGSVKPLAFVGGKSRDATGLRKPVVKVHGRRMLYCITLRPLFFRASTPEARVETLLHELFHVSATFDGTLDPSRRHACIGAAFRNSFRPLVRRYLRRCPVEVLAPFAHRGPVRVLQWLERPPAFHVPRPSKNRRRYTEDQLFMTTLELRTKRRKARPAVH
jgi:predicted metallopeptidase